ncbi:MAG: GNAT family N-acetyltransferase [Clostridiales bacterium]|nr:GNAT family N-acetyltransferase [Clostridiales bacterium]
MKEECVVKIVEENKDDFMELLLLADEQEDMVRRYLDRGTLFALYDGELVSICVVTEEGEGEYEIQNLATREEYQRKGYGRALIHHVLEHYKGPGRIMWVGTGDSPMTVPFYESCGFVYSHRLANYIVEHYDHPIFENGVQLTDKVYFKKALS